MNELRELFKNIILNKEEMPFDFDEVWGWIGYSSKQKALEMLEQNFVEGVEYSILGKKKTTEKGGRPATYIVLSVDCFKAFCMLAQTQKGKDVRLYYIQHEKEFNKDGIFKKKL